MKEFYNKKAAFNYHFLEKFEAGIALTGDEIKALRAGKISLADAYALVRGGEAILVNATIGPYEKGVYPADPRRDRKLLLHKKEIDYLVGKLAGANLTLVPVRLYFRRNYAKIEIALARGKKQYDKRESIKQKEVKREAQATLRKDKMEYRKEQEKKYFNK